MIITTLASRDAITNTAIVWFVVAFFVWGNEGRDPPTALTPPGHTLSGHRQAG